MRILVVQNCSDAGLGQIAPVLNDAGFAVDIRHSYSGESLPHNDDDYHGLIVLGGEQNALADDEFPYFPHLLRLIRTFGDSDIAVLGICLGAQLVARAYGGENLLDRPMEFGWKEVRLTGAGQNDPVLSAAEASFYSFHWHSDTFALPDGAVHLADSNMTPHQAFRIGRAIYGTQFHFEADTRLVTNWLEKQAPLIDSIEPGWPQRFLEMVTNEGVKADETGRALARAWASMVQG